MRLLRILLYQSDVIELIEKHASVSYLLFYDILHVHSLSKHIHQMQEAAAVCILSHAMFYNMHIHIYDLRTEW